MIDLPFQKWKILSSKDERDDNVYDGSCACTIVGLIMNGNYVELHVRLCGQITLGHQSKPFDASISVA